MHHLRLLSSGVISKFGKISQFFYCFLLEVKYRVLKYKTIEQSLVWKRKLKQGVKEKTQNIETKERKGKREVPNKKYHVPY